MGNNNNEFDKNRKERITDLVIGGILIVIVLTFVFYNIYELTKIR